MVCARVPSTAALAALAGWLLAALAAWRLHGEVDLGSQALPVVLAAAWSGLWLRPAATASACTAAMLAFNWCFVPPAGSLKVDLRSHGLLLATLLVVSVSVSLLVARQRAAAERDARGAQRLRQLLEVGERLRGATTPDGLLPVLAQSLQPFGFASLAMLARQGLAGEPTADEASGLRECMAQGVAFGPGTGRYTQQPNLYLPLRGHRRAVGAVVLRPVTPPGAQERQHAQALCDQAGLVLERAEALEDAAREARLASEQQLRSTFLAAVSHDYRTPLAAILGSASALREQGERLAPAQREQLAGRIVDEVEQLARLTDNALQLARLDAPGVQVAMDWESAEELVGSVLARVRQRDAAQRVKARIAPALPLVRCNAVLVVQLLENLVDNALKYSPPPRPIELQVRQEAGALVIAVRDRGPGVPPAWRQRIFEVFQRGDPPPDADADTPRPRGAGVGLALCRAIARAHGGEVGVRARRHGGASFELRLPLAETPAEAVV